jgi:putative component of membrane protein insertase Oxa1/YidC/SpoIIIJ protein YidD
MIEAIREWGVLRGGWMGVKRLASCGPWGGCGHDPVPKRKDTFFNSHEK